MWVRSFLINFILILVVVGCGTESPKGPETGVPPRGKLISNLRVGDNLRAALEVEHRVDSRELCFQLVEAPDKSRSLEYSSSRCPQEGLANQAELKFPLLAFPNANELASPASDLIVFQAFVPLGLVTTSPNGEFVLQDLCSVGPEYKANCALQFSQGRLTGVNLETATPVLRMIREKKYQTEAELLRGQVANLKNQIMGTEQNLKTKDSLIATQAASMLTIAEEIEKQRTAVTGTVNDLLVGTAEKPGYSKQLEASRKSIDELQAVLTLRLETELKAFEEKILSLRLEYQALEVALAERVKERDELAAKLAVPGLSPEEQPGLESKLTEKISEVGKTYLDAIQKQKSLRAAVEEKEKSAAGVADAQDRKALSELKRKSGTLQALISRLNAVSQNLAKAGALVGEVKELVKAGDLPKGTLALTKAVMHLQAAVVVFGAL